jgi:hypothetical protein
LFFCFNTDIDIDSLGIVQQQQQLCWNIHFFVVQLVVVICAGRVLEETW